MTHLPSKRLTPEEMDRVEALVKIHGEPVTACMLQVSVPTMARACSRFESKVTSIQLIRSSLEAAENGSAMDPAKRQEINDRARAMAVNYREAARNQRNTAKVALQFALDELTYTASLPSQKPVAPPKRAKKPGVATQEESDQVRLLHHYYGDDTPGILGITPKETRIAMMGPGCVHHISAAALNRLDASLRSPRVKEMIDAKRNP